MQLILTVPPGTIDGTISITASGSDSLYYSVDSGYTYQASSSFSSLDTGNYYVFVIDSIGGCHKSFQSNPVRIDLPICPIEAVNDLVVTNDTLAISIGVLQNDTTYFGFDTTSLDTLSSPHYGTLTINTNGTFTYTPTSSGFYTDTFIYKICDTNSINMTCDSAKVTIAVNSSTECLIGLTNSSFEYFNGCPEDLVPQHSQFGNVIKVWENALSNVISTPDIFVVNTTCSFDDFSASGTTVSSRQNYEGCAWAGLFLNFNDGVGDAKYKEYITQRVDIIAGRTYTLQVDLAKSNHITSSTLEDDFGIYGYTGPTPLSQLNFCPLDTVGSTIPTLATISKDDITSVRKVFTISFTPDQNFEYLVFGGTDCGNSATATGYVFIDRIFLEDNSNTTLNPFVKYVTNDPGLCCFSDLKSAFTLTGNTPPTGATISWGQSVSNPESVTFTQANDSVTGIGGSGYLTAGDYEFYYTFTKNGCSATDTFDVTVNPPTAVYAGKDTTVCGMNSGRYVYSYESISNGTWYLILNDSSSVRLPLYSDFNYDQYGIYTGSSTNEIYFVNPQDTADLYMQVTDQCGTDFRDSVRIIMNDVGIVATTPLCPGNQGLARQNNSSSYPWLEDKANLSFAWSQVSGPGVVTFDEPSRWDSTTFTIAGATGDYWIALTVTDANTGCVFGATHRVVVTEPPVVDAPDVTQCMGIDDREIEMVATPSPSDITANGYNTWWSMISEDGSEWTFPKRLGGSNDGTDEGNVRVNTYPPVWSSEANFDIYNPQDTVIFIWHLINQCGLVSDTLMDTMTAIMNDVTITIPSESKSLCPNEIGYSFQTNQNWQRRLKNKSHLQFSWSKVVGPGPLTWVDSTVVDSVQFPEL